MPNVRTKSQPVPRGMTASSTPSALGDAVDDLVHGAVAADDHEQLARLPRRRRAASAVELPRLLGDERVSREPERGCAVRDLGPALARRASAGGRVDEEDGAAGLMAVLAGRRGVERDPRHPVDRGTQLVVGDPHELALDDDVAHREQAAAVDAAQRGRP